MLQEIVLYIVAVFMIAFVLGYKAYEVYSPRYSIVEKLKDQKICSEEFNRCFYVKEIK